MAKNTNLKKNEGFDYKKFLSNWNKLDSIIGFIVGSATTFTVSMAFSNLYTIPQIIGYIRPFVLPLILMVAFSYCMQNSWAVMKKRKFPFHAKNGWDGFYGNLISLGWIIGGLFFIASGTPEIWTAILEWATKQ